MPPYDLDLLLQQLEEQGWQDAPPDMQVRNAQGGKCQQCPCQADGYTDASTAVPGVSGCPPCVAAQTSWHAGGSCYRHVIRGGKGREGQPAEPAGMHANIATTNLHTSSQPQMVASSHA